MRKQLIYDLPTRFFHWLFAGLFVTAFLIAKTIDDDSAAFSYHMLAGFLLVSVVVLRIIWGFIGSDYARFSSFALQPRELFTYLSGILSGDRKKWAGHNPASSWASLAMFGFAIGLAVTGYLMVNGQKESFEDIHELFANGFLVTVLMHVAGVLLHALRHRDGIAWTMLNGQKEGLQESLAISQSRPVMAFFFLTLAAVFSFYLLKNFDNQSQSLNLFGNVLQLGENEGHADEPQDSRMHKDEDDED